MSYWAPNNFFQPFVDNAFHYGKTNRYLTTSDGISTTAIDNFREGVNLRTSAELFRSNQPKVFVTDGSEDLDIRPNGNISHETSFLTFGQAVDFVQYTGNSLFDDAHVGIEASNGTLNYLINIVEVVEGNLDAGAIFPIFMNGGPQFLEEAIIEPFTIPDRLPSNESSQELARGIFATLEGGGKPDERRFGTSVVNSYIDREEPLMVRPYLEFDANNIIITGNNGDVIKVITTRYSAISDQTVFSKIFPWVDEDRGVFFPRITNTVDLLSASYNGFPYYHRNYETSDTMLQTRDQKSAVCGYGYYGGDAALYGTDSVAFGGYFRGS